VKSADKKSILTGNWLRIELGDALRQINCLACCRLAFSPPTLQFRGGFHALVS